MMSEKNIALARKLCALPDDYWDSKPDHPKEYTHGIHSYPGVMDSAISRNLIRIVKEIQPVHSLFDPFAGSGTVLVEGMLSGIETIVGNDRNPLALLLCNAKTTPLPVAELRKTVYELLRNIAKIRNQFTNELNGVDVFFTDVLNLDLSSRKLWGEYAPNFLTEYCRKRNFPFEIPQFKHLGYWFKPRVILELSIIKSQLVQIPDPDLKVYCLVAFSETIRLVSNSQNKESKLHRMPAKQVLEYAPNVFQIFQDIILRNLDRMQEFCRALDANNLHSHVKLYRTDSCTLESIPDDAFDLVITSPPYGDSKTAVAYGEFSRLSLQWLGLDTMTDQEILQLDKTLLGGRPNKKSFENTLPSKVLRNALNQIARDDCKRACEVYSFYDDLNRAIGSIALKTKSGAYQFWVVGNRTIKDELLETDLIITELAKHHNLTPIDILSCNMSKKVMPAWNTPPNIRTLLNRTLTMEHIVILRKD